MNSASTMLGEVSVWSLLVNIKGHPAKVMMNAEGDRALDFSGIGSAGMVDGGKKVVVSGRIVWRKKMDGESNHEIKLQTL